MGRFNVGNNTHKLKNDIQNINRQQTYNVGGHDNHLGNSIDLNNQEDSRIFVDRQ